MNKNRKYLFKYPSIFAAIIFLLTLASWILITQRQTVHDRERFKNYTEQINHQIEFRMETYLNALVQASSMLEVTKGIDRKSFKKYIDSLNIIRDYPGILGIGYTQKILKKDLQQHIKKVRAEGYPDYKVWPEDPRDVYFSIVYLEPFNWRNKRAFGYDMFTDPTRHRAMARAMNTAGAAISGRVELVQETKDGPQPGFLIYVPVYNRDVQFLSLEERETALMGFIYSPFRAHDLFNEIFSHIEKNVPLEVHIYSKDKAGIEELFALHNTPNKHYKPRFMTETDLTLAQKEWKVVLSSLPGLEEKTRHYPLIILLLGTLISVLVYWILKKQAGHSQEEEEKSAELEIINAVGRRLSAELELKNLVPLVTTIGLDNISAEYGAFFYRKDDSEDELGLFSYLGAQEEDFNQFVLPSRSQRTTLSHDITKDIRYGSNLPEQSISTGNLPIKSYLAVYVIARSGEVLGCLIYGHKEAGFFTKKEKNLIESIAVQAAISIENARYFKSAHDAINARDEFLNVASHELKTPITSLKLMFQVANKMINENKEKVFEREDVIKRVVKSVALLDRMNALIEEMLDSTRASVSQLNVKKELIDLNVLTAEVIERFKEQLESQGVFYDFTPSPEKAHIYGDNYRLEQVISNLISNAIKYGEGRPISLSVYKQYSNIILKVKDQGLGIPKDKLERIFNRYERVTKGSSITGLGLGLYISKNIVHAHGGTLNVESILGEGSTFTMSIPEARK